MRTRHLACDTTTCPMRQQCRRSPESDAPPPPAGTKQDWLINQQYGSHGCQHYSPTDLSEAA